MDHCSQNRRYGGAAPPIASPSTKRHYSPHSPADEQTGIPAAARAVLTLLILLFGALASGCRPVETRFDILSFRNPLGPERFSEKFDPGAFAGNAHDNLDVVFDMPATLARMNVPKIGRPDPQSQPAEDPAPEEEVPVSQLIHLQVFWQPVPGTTFAESTQTNATIIYCLTMGRNTIAYRGAGFVYYTKSRDGSKIEGRIESSDLVPTDYMNEPVDLFGPCRLEGTFVAYENRRAVVDVIQRLRKSIGPPGASPPNHHGPRWP